MANPKTKTDRMDDFQIDKFLKRMAELSKREMLLEADKSLQFGTAHRGVITRRKKPVDDGSEAYCRVVEEFLFFIRTGEKPNGVYDEEFANFKPVIERLVANDEMEPEIMKLFR